MKRRIQGARIVLGLGLVFGLAAGCGDTAGPPAAAVPMPPPAAPAPPPTATPVAAVFSPALCTLPEPGTREALVTGEPFARSPAYALPIHLDQANLFVELEETRLRRFSLATGQPNGDHDLGSPRARRYFRIIGSDARWTYVWSSSNTETSIERQAELIAVDFPNQIDRSLWSGRSDSPTPQIPVLIDARAITWVQTIQSGDELLAEIIRTDLDGGQPRSLGRTAFLWPLLQDADHLIWAERSSGQSPPGTRIRMLSKLGGTPVLLVDGLPDRVQLATFADRLFLILDPNGSAACDGTIFEVRKDLVSLRPVARAPGPGLLFPHARGFLWYEPIESGFPRVARIWSLDAGTARLLVDARGERFGPSLLGIEGDFLYWSFEDRILRARVP